MYLAGRIWLVVCYHLALVRPHVSPHVNLKRTCFSAAISYTLVSTWLQASETYMEAADLARHPRAHCAKCISPLSTYTEKALVTAPV